MAGWGERARSFGAVAQQYERYRYGYPDEVVDLISAYADGPVATALEIGAGTGLATRVFVRRGVAVTATDPDAAMLAELVRHVPTGATVVQAAFEDLPPELLAGRFDVVFAAAALHWTDPATRWQRVAALLRDGGVFANFGGPATLADPDVEEAVRAARRPWLEDDGLPSPDGGGREGWQKWPADELERSGLFVDVRQVLIERRLHVPAADYVGHLSTLSAYVTLPPDLRDRVLEAVAAVLPDPVELVADVDVHLARRPAG